MLAAFVGGCGLLALHLQGGVSEFHRLLPSDLYFNPFARGIATDLGAGLSLLVGVLCTQAYIQAVVSARSLGISRAGILGCAFFVPLIGLAGIFVGMYMKLNHPDIPPAGALPVFVMRELPPLLAGMILATLLLTLTGTGAGLALGASSMLCHDVYKVFLRKDASDAALLRASRLILAGVLLAALPLVYWNLDSLILDWSYLAMGLRGAAAFLPLCAALFLPGRVKKRAVFLSMLVATPGLLFLKAVIPPGRIDPLFPAMGLAAVFLLIGLRGKP